MLSQDQLDLIFTTKQARKSGKSKTGKVFLREEAGKLISEPIKKSGDYDFGKHVGNVGTMKRSSKGRTYRLPNGSRSYMGYDFDQSKPAVVAYRA